MLRPSATTAGVGVQPPARLRSLSSDWCFDLIVAVAAYFHGVWSIAVPMAVRLSLLPFAPFAHAALG
jgi:hypothetical protein